MGKCLMRLLADEDVRQIKEEAVRILEEVGVVVSHGEAKKMLEASGARVDHQTDLVRVPNNLTEECLKRLPQKVTLGGRGVDNDIVLEPGNEKTYGRS